MTLLMTLYADDDDFLELDTSSLAFLQNLDSHVNGSLRLSDNDLDSIPGESLHDSLCFRTVTWSVSCGKVVKIFI